MSSSREGEEQAQAAQPQFHVGCARELFQALESPDGAIRLAALHAVQEAPATALGFGPHAERDLVDVLLSQAERNRGGLEWLSWIGTLAAIRDPRIVRLFASLLATESHTELLFVLANYLRAASLEQFKAELRAALMQDASPARARAVASVLATCTRLSTGEALRIGLLQPAAGTPLPAFSATHNEWLSELAGPFESEARFELQRQGASTLSALVEHWDALSSRARTWLLRWAAETQPDLIADRTRETLADKPEELLLPALEAATKMKDVPADLDDVIVPLLEHSDERIRRAAVMACRSGVDWRRFFEREPSVLVQQACMAKIIDREGRDAVPFALQQLASPDWRIRAAAVDGLLSLGEWGIRAALMLLPQADESVRIGIARMVVHSGDDRLLNEFVYRCSQPVGTEA